MKKLTRAAIGLLIFLFCSSLDYPYTVRIYPVKLDHQLHYGLPGELSFTATGAYFHRFRGRFNCAVFVDLENEGNKTTWLDRPDFFIISSRGEEFKAQPFSTVNEKGLIPKTTNYPDHYAVAPGKRVNYIFSWSAPQKFSYKSFKEHIMADTVYLMNKNGSKQDTLALLVLKRK